MRKLLALAGIMVLIIATFIIPDFNQSVAEVSVDSGAEASDSTNISEVDKSPEMRSYFVVFLRRGPKWTADMTPEIEKILEEHWANIDKMYDAGKLAAVGPFLDPEDEGDLAGMMIFRVDSMEEAQELLKKDPTIESGRFTLEFHPWYGASTLGY